MRRASPRTRRARDEFTSSARSRCSTPTRSCSPHAPSWPPRPRTLQRSRAADALGRFFAWWSGAPPLELARHYVQTFDLHKRCALYLTFYSLGDRRDRGLALLRLQQALPRRRPAARGLRAARLPAGDARVRRPRATRAGRAGAVASTAPRSSSSASRSASSTARTRTCSTPSASSSVGYRPASGSASTGS